MQLMQKNTLIQNIIFQFKSGEKQQKMDKLITENQTSDITGHLGMKIEWDYKHFL
jgi:hypothetical protein